MKSHASFVEEELARERKMREPKESKFRQIRSRFEKIFRINRDPLSQFHFTTEEEFRARADNSHSIALQSNVYARLAEVGALTTGECLKAIEQSLIRDAIGRFVKEDQP